MSHPNTDGEVSAILRSVDSVDPLMVGTTTARFVATGAVTNGHFGLFRWDMSAQARRRYPALPPDVHRVVLRPVRFGEALRRRQLGPGLRR